jgi:hypothetical protein
MSKASEMPAEASAANPGPALSGQTIGAGTDTSTIDRAPLKAVRGREIDSTDDLSDVLAGEGADTHDNTDSEEDDLGTADTGAADTSAEGEDAAQADIPMPEGFEERTWGTLTPEARQAVHGMAVAQAQALAQERQAGAAVRGERDRQINAAGALLARQSRMLNTPALTGRRSARQILRRMCSSPGSTPSARRPSSSSESVSGRLLRQCRLSVRLSISRACRTRWPPLNPD